MYVDELLDRSDELMHYGTPRHSGRYPWGSGERPFQGDKVSFKPSVKKYVVGKKTTRANKEAMDKAVRDIRNYLYTLTPIPDSDYKKLKKGINIPGDSNGYYKGKTVVSASAYNKFKKTLDKYENKVNKLDVVDDKTFTNLVIKQNARKETLAGAVSAAAVAIPLTLLMSDSDEDNYIAELADKADDLEHGGPGSGRFPWGSGERPYQHRLPPGYMRFALPSASGEYHYSHSTSRSTRKAKAGAQNSSSQSTEEQQKQERHEWEREDRARRHAQEDKKAREDAEDRARKHAQEDRKAKQDAQDRYQKQQKDKQDKIKAEEKEREDLEDAYWKEVTNMTNQLSSIRTHAKNLKAASKPVKDVTKKMSDQQLTELTNRLKLENSYLKELNTRQGYNARPDKVENLLGLLGDVSSMGRSASKVYRTTVKQRKYL